MRKIPILLLALTCASQGFEGSGPQSLEGKVKIELGMMCYEGCEPPLENRLLKLADAGAVGDVLVKLIHQYKTARSPGPEYLYLRMSISAAGKLGVVAAVPALLEFAKSSQPGRDPRDADDLKMLSYQSITEIDPKGNKEFLLEALRDKTHIIRYFAAMGLSKTDDPSVLPELDVAASREPSHVAFLEMQALADSLRARLSADSK